jgi:hypothetical protein
MNQSISINVSIIRATTRAKIIKAVGVIPNRRRDAVAANDVRPSTRK